MSHFSGSGATAGVGCTFGSTKLNMPRSCENSSAEEKYRGYRSARMRGLHYFMMKLLIGYTLFMGWCVGLTYSFTSQSALG